MKRLNVSLSNIGKAGELMVAAKLFMMGLEAYNTNNTINNSAVYDLAVINPVTYTQHLVQVKTTTEKRAEWIVNPAQIKPGLIFVFVHYDPITDHADYYVVPGEEVTKYAIEDNQKWLAEKPTRSKKNPFRKFRVGTVSWNHTDESHWKNRWDLLK